MLRAIRTLERQTLTDAHWIYGGSMDTIIASVHGGRQGHMPTWDRRLTTEEIARFRSTYTISERCDHDPTCRGRSQCMVAWLLVGGIAAVCRRQCASSTAAFQSQPDCVARLKDTGDSRAIGPPSPCAEGEDDGRGRQILLAAERNIGHR